jgi:Cu/Ag efflux protein CusF
MRLFSRLTVSVLGLTLVCAAVPVRAHVDAYLATLKAPNGGQLRMTGPYHYELVVARDSRTVKEQAVVVYVSNHAFEKVATAGAQGTVNLRAGLINATVTLSPDGDNRMKGFAKYAATHDLQALVSIALAGQPALQARFAPLAPPEAVASSPGAAQNPPPIDSAWVAATVKKIDKSKGTVTLAHGPLPNGMPPMTMSFRVKQREWLDHMMQGQKIRFKTDNEDGALTVLRYEALP